MSNYGFQGVCLSKNKVCDSFLLKFYKGKAREHKTCTSLKIDPESMHFDFNMVSGLSTRLVQKKMDRPCIDSMTRHLLSKPKTNYMSRMMMNCVLKILQLDQPLKSIEPYFADPDFTDSSSNWSTHFLSSGNVVYTPAKSENEILSVPEK